MPYNNYCKPDVIVLGHVGHVDSQLHDAVLHVDIVAVDDGDDDRVEVDRVAVVEIAVMRRMMHLMMTGHHSG